MPIEIIKNRKMRQHSPVNQIKPNSQLLEEIRNLLFNPKSMQTYEN
jgi:hypothetical protein